MTLDEQVARAMWQNGGGAETPAFSTDPATTPIILAEVERRGLQDRYIKELFAIVMPQSERWDITLNDESGGYIDRLSLFTLLNATPEQHAHAFVICATPAP